MPETNAIAFDVVQFPRTAPSLRRLVGRICANPHDRYLPQAGTWWVTSEFQYLSPEADRITEILPSRNSSGACGADTALLPRISGIHGIRTSTVNEQDDAFCRMWTPYISLSVCDRRHVKISPASASAAPQFALEPSGRDER